MMGLAEIRHANEKPRQWARETDRDHPSKKLARELAAAKTPKETD